MITSSLAVGALTAAVPPQETVDHVEATVQLVLALE
jgi:hypothetical protein